MKKLQTTFTGGNMKALETRYKGFQILISDGFGDGPIEGEQWSLSIYKLDKELREYSDSPIKGFAGKRYDQTKALKKAKDYINKKVASKK